jgi:hypothetical protein
MNGLVPSPVPTNQALIRTGALIAAITLGALLAEGPATISFREAAEGSGIRFITASSHTGQKYLPESMVGGVAMLDYDNDGQQDLFFVNGAALQDPMPPGSQPDKSDPRFWNRLYRGNRDGTFTDVTKKAGLAGHSFGMGVAVADYDNDGFPDLYVTNLGRNILYHNNGDGTFTDVTGRAGVAGAGWSTGAAFVDYDRDGKLDLFVTRYLEWDFAGNPICGERRAGYRSYCHPNQFKPISHLIYHNNGDGTFTDVSRKSGIAAFPGKGLGIAIGDFDRDGWPDIFVANDSSPQQLFRNNHDGTFSDVALILGLAYNDDGEAFAGMGTDFADYDNDGWPDIFVNSLANQRYALFHNDKGRSFSYVSQPSGIAGISLLHSGWGARFADFDNDGWKDLFVAQGHVMDNIDLTQPAVRYREPLLLMRNNGGRFENVSATSGLPFQTPLAARGAAFGDINNDGLIDVVITCNDGPTKLLMNAGGNGNHWLLINTVGTVSNRDGIGAAIRIVSDSGMEQYGYVSTAGSYLSASDKRVHFGLGRDRKIRLVEVKWPGGTVQKLENIDADQILNIHEPASSRSGAGGRGVR